MRQVFLNHSSYDIKENESVLDGLLRQGVEHPHACRAGTCQSCLCRLDNNLDENADKKLINPAWQKGLKPSLAAKNYFLPCVSYLEEDQKISIALADLDQSSVSVKILEKFKFNHNVLCLRLSLADSNQSTLEQYLPGQYISLINPLGALRSYSIANIPKIDAYLELHIKIVPDGLMSQFLEHQAEVGTSLNIRGPLGSCHYFNPTKQAYPIILIGTGTGLAPLFGILKEALLQQHSGLIYLIHGGVKQEDLYLDFALKNLMTQHKNFIYKTSVLEHLDHPNHLAMDQLLEHAVKDLKNSNQAPKIYICGPAEMTQKLKINAFLSGVPSGNIESDAFI